MLKFYNFLSRQIEEFKPIETIVGLYTCGPTVYDFAHIGNLRTYIFEDILKRTLKLNGFKVKHVMNITDIDDKIIKRSREEGVGYRELGEKYEKAFFEDLAKLKIEKADLYPRATDHINEMISLIERLIKKGLAYKTDDGVFFAINKFPSYGRLSQIDKKNLKTGARIEADLYEKENPADFALWKKVKPGEPAWNAPFGAGRPGWHIECSAMALKYLDDVFDGETVYPERGRGIDIHTGAVDLLFPHHENEIAQSDGATGKNFVNFWLEGEHLLVEGQKMAKSLGNYYTLSDLVKKSFNPLAFRYLVLTCHYRSKLNFTWKSLEAAQNALDNLCEEITQMPEAKIGCAQFEEDFLSALSNDLDTPKAIAILWELLKSDYPASAKKKTLLWMDQVLGLGFDKVAKPELPAGVAELIEGREKARQAGDWDLADKIREEIKAKGVEIEDTPTGPIWKVKIKRS